VVDLQGHSLNYYLLLSVVAEIIIQYNIIFWRHIFYQSNLNANMRIRFILFFNKYVSAERMLKYIKLIGIHVTLKFIGVPRLTYIAR